MRLLAIDQGTTSTRAILFDPEGRSETLLTRTHRQHRPRPARVEHDPLELLADVEACLAAGLARGAETFGLANQGESCLGWDAATGEPVSPVIVWQDARTEPETRALERAGLAPEVAARAGLPLDPYFSASKLGWIVAHLPKARGLLRRGRLRLGTTDAFFRDRLTGRFETDLATAARTSLLNLATRGWDAELCRVFGVPIETLPRITPCNGDLGAAAGLPLSASIVDQQAALFGHGCRAPGETKITFGTGAFVLAVAGPAPPAPGHGPLPTVAWQLAAEPPVYALEGGVYTAAAALDWARGLGLFADFAELETLPPGSALARGLAFVPALAGLACPHWDRSARGAWLGLTLDTGRPDLLRALLEGVAYRTAEILAAIEPLTPILPPISIDGGMTRSPAFCRILADIARRDIRVSEEAERTALGVAMLSALAHATPLAPPAPGRTLRPDPNYPDLRDTFARARDAARAGTP